MDSSNEEHMDNTTTVLPEPEIVIDFPWIDFVFFFTTTTLIIILNGIVLIILAKIGGKKLKKNVHNIQILSLSVSDIMVGVTLIPMQISFYAEEMTHLQCAVRCGAFLVAFMASMLHVCIICIDRWWVIYFKAQQTQKQFLPRCIVLLTSTWTLAFVIEFIPLVMWRDSIKANVVCSISTIFGDFFHEAFAYLAITHTSVLICVTVFYCMIILCIVKGRARINANTSRINMSVASSTTTINNGGHNLMFPSPARFATRFLTPDLIGRKVSESNRGVSNSDLSIPGSNDPRRKSDARQRRALKTIGLIITIHTLCASPLIIMLFIEVIEAGRVSLTWHHVMFCIACLSCVGNPLLYAFRVPEVRKMVRAPCNAAAGQMF